MLPYRPRSCRKPQLAGRNAWSVEGLSFGNESSVEAAARMSSYRTRQPLFQGGDLTPRFTWSDNNFGDLDTKEDCYGNRDWYWCFDWRCARSALECFHSHSGYNSGGTWYRRRWSGERR